MIREDEATSTLKTVQKATVTVRKHTESKHAVYCIEWVYQAYIGLQLQGVPNFNPGSSLLHEPSDFETKETRCH